MAAGGKRKDAKNEKKKYFTIEEANKALPLVRAIVADIVAKYAAVSERKSRLDQIRESRSSPAKIPRLARSVRRRVGAG